MIPILTTIGWIILLILTAILVCIILWKTFTFILALLMDAAGLIFSIIVVAIIILGVGIIL